MMHSRVLVRFQYGLFFSDVLSFSLCHQRFTDD